MKIVVVGGGWAGCAAALTAVKSGAEVTLLERTDMLLGTGLVGGIMRNNARFTAAQEMTALGGGELFRLADACLRHKSVSFAGHDHADLYDIARMPVAVGERLIKAGVKVVMLARVHKADADAGRVLRVVTGDEKAYEADAFVDATGTFGPMNNCTKHGNGCVMCVMRCPSFGGRVSLAGLAGVKEKTGTRENGALGSMSGACKLMKDSLSKELQTRLNLQGVLTIPLPPELSNNRLSQKACQQYALEAFHENLIVLDTGHAKLMTSYLELITLRQIPGFENARYEDPYAGGLGNSMRFFDMSPRDDSLHVTGLENVFCAGEKAGPLVGHTEAIVTGALAGHNAARNTLRLAPLILPRSLAVGEAIAYAREKTAEDAGLSLRFTFSGSVLLERLKTLNLYTTDIPAIEDRVKAAGMTNALARFA